MPDFSPPAGVDLLTLEGSLLSGAPFGMHEILPSKVAISVGSKSVSEGPQLHLFLMEQFNMAY